VLQSIQAPRADNPAERMDLSST